MIIANLKRFNNIRKEYGLTIAINLYYRYIFFRNTKYIDYLSSILTKEFKNIIEKYRNAAYIEEKKRSKIIWCFWWQGEQQIPELPHLCIKTIKKNTPDNYKFIFLDKNNYHKYVKIPEHIEKKFRDNRITITHYSDILRLNLLSQKGGIWIDSTVFVSNKIPEEITDKSFWSIKIPTKKLSEKSYGQAISNGKYAGFILSAQKNSPTINFTKECIEQYWKNHNSLVEYFIQILLIRIAYNNIPSAKAEIENYSENNINIYELEKLLNTKYNEKEYLKATKDTTFFKLSWKKQYIKEINGKETIFGHMLKMYNIDDKGTKK